MTALIMSKLYFLPITTTKHKHESSRDAHITVTVPGHNCATLLVPVHKVHNVLTVFQLKTTWRLGNVQLVLIVPVVEVFLQEDLFHF